MTRPDQIGERSEPRTKADATERATVVPVSHGEATDMTFDWGTALRTELIRRAELHMAKTGAPSYVSRGTRPTRLFEPYAGGVRHGNFIDASYQAIRGDSVSWGRTQKPHPQRDALPPEKQMAARELDSCTSSDALLMNCFCYPGTAAGIISALLPSASYSPPEFGVRGEVALSSGTHDATEIDMRIGGAIFEAKLTEHDFTSRPKAHVERYAQFSEVFHLDALPQVQDDYQGYQLIRNVLAANRHGWTFYVICDARRPDLIRDWWAVHSAIRDVKLRTRCGVVLWQEIARACPAPLRTFLAQKYGIGDEPGG